MQLLVIPNKLEEDKWHAIELYHINNKLIAYINTELVLNAECEGYVPSLNYNMNTIGCAVINGEITNCFQGEMSASYFLKTSSKQLGRMHEFLALNWGRLHGLAEKSAKDWSWFQRKAFLQANPKSSEPAQKLYVVEKGKQNVDVFNAIESVYGNDVIYHSAPAQDTFINIGGIKTILPVLYKLIKWQADNEFL